ncbi:MAG: hypothetical protein ACI9DC_004752 [Gammaproteobacteria bacterium]|jgi:uncharacterized protein YyaL (SSP411 family)
MAIDTLHAISNGGIYDHLGGGFCRYSVDREWMIPHFEKNALRQRAAVTTVCVGTAVARR